MTLQERTVESIVVGRRHRKELGDLKPLMDSIQRSGLLQPITVTPDGVLICGRRRLEAIRRLGWRRVRVWMRAGISDGLEMLVAEYEENSTHKPLSNMEQAALYREIRDLIREDAARRQEASRFGSGESPEPLQPFPPESRHERESRAQAARFVSGRDSHQRLERILAMERVAADRTASNVVRQQAETELQSVRDGGPVDPAWTRLQAFIRFEELNGPPPPEEVSQVLDTAVKDARASRARRIADNRRRRQAEAATTKRSMRSFCLKWAEQVGWSRKYSAEEAAALAPEDWAIFIQVIDECQRFVAEVERQRTQTQPPAA